MKRESIIYELGVLAKRIEEFLKEVESSKLKMEELKNELKRLDEEEKTMSKWRWVPGNWISVHPNKKFDIKWYADKVKKDMIEKFPDDFVGYHISFYWNAVQKDENTYDFEQLDYFVKTVTGLGKAVSFEVKERSFSTEESTSPLWIVPKHIAPYLYKAETNRVFPKMDNREYIDLFLGLHKKLAERYHSNKLVVGVRGLNESAIEPPIGGKIDGKKYLDNLIYLFDELRKIWKDCMLRMSINFFQGNDSKALDTLFEYIRKNPGVVLDWPDPFTQSYRTQLIDGDVSGNFIEREEVKLNGKKVGDIHRVFEIEPHESPIPNEFKGKYVFRKLSDKITNLKIGDKIVGEKSGAAMTIKKAKSSGSVFIRSIAHIFAEKNKGLIPIMPSADTTTLFYEEKTKVSDMPEVYRYYTQYCGVNGIVWHDLYAGRPMGFQPFFLENAVVPAIRSGKTKIDTNLPKNMQ